MTTFFVAPYEPLTWASTSSALEIDPDWYKRQLEERWPGIEFFRPGTYYVLFWGFPSTAKGTAGPLAGLQDNLQVVSMDAPFEEFIVWHRHIISDEYTLYLFNESSSNSLELTDKLTIEEVERFVGHRRRG